MFADGAAQAKGNLNNKMVQFSGTNVGLGVGDLGSNVGSAMVCCVTLAVCLTSPSLKNLSYNMKDLDQQGSMSWELSPRCSPGWRAVTRPWMEATQRMRWWTSQVAFPSPST